MNMYEAELQTKNVDAGKIGLEKLMGIGLVRKFWIYNWYPQ